MGAKSTYTIQTAPQLGAGQFYCLKFDPDQIQPESYNIVDLKGSLVCTCPAGGRFCRHKKMLRRFQAENRVDSGWMLQFDADKWIPPQNPED